MKKILALLLALCMVLGLAACGSGSNAPAASGGKKTFVFGDTTFNAENEEPDINPISTPITPTRAGPAFATASARR